MVEDREQDIREDMLIALYLTGERESGFTDECMKTCTKILDIIRRVRKELTEEEKNEV